MTDENVRANVADEIRLAHDALRAAEALLTLGLPADAASRTYYAAFHAARALVYSQGLEARSQRGVQTLLQRNFVRTGRLDATLAKDLVQLESLRAAGDYDSGFSLGVAAIAPERERSRRFVAAAETLLRDGGLLG